MLSYSQDICNLKFLNDHFRISIPLFDDWKHICCVINIDVNPSEAITYINGVEITRLNHSSWEYLSANPGALVIGQDQDCLGGCLEARQQCLGKVTLFNVWDFLLSANDVQDLYNGVGTETGNFLAWRDIKKFAKGYVYPISGSPWMKWTGK